MPNVKVRSSDGVEFILTTEVAYRSKKIEETCKHQGLNEPVTFSEVNEYMMDKVITWMKQYKDGSPFDIQDQGEDETYKYNEWDYQYLKMERETLFRLAKASLDMEVRGLRNFLGQALANLLKGKTVAQMRAVIGYPRENPVAHRRRPAL